MPAFDLPREELERYRPSVDEPDDFDDFWAATLAEARSYDLGLRLEPVEPWLTQVEAFDVTFAGFGGHPIKAWHLRPAGVPASRRLPVVVEYLGYGLGRGLAFERLTWANAGYAHLVVDTRGQGSSSLGGFAGDTPDPVGAGPSVPGFMTRGILEPETYYYRRLITDAVRAVDAARALPGVDPDRVAVVGGSQGGGLALAVSGLVDGLVAAMPDVPFLTHWRRALDVTDDLPYFEVVRYLQTHRDHEDAVFRTLAYHEGLSFAQRATAPALFSTALRDTTCPPSTVFAAYHHYGSRAAVRPAAEIIVYPFNGHQGGQAFQVLRQVRWLAGVLAA